MMYGAGGAQRGLQVAGTQAQDPGVVRPGHWGPRGKVLQPFPALGVSGEAGSSLQEHPVGAHP